jgi:hypothetical protein
VRDTKHFLAMLSERGIRLDWADAAVGSPDQVEEPGDGTVHYLKRIESNGNRWLRVIVNPLETPPARVTAFFDRRLRRQGI